MNVQKYLLPSLDNMDAIFCMNPELEIVYLNSAAERLFGCSTMEFYGRDATVVMPTRYRDLFTETVTEVLDFDRSSGRKTLEIQGLKHPGIEFSIILSLCALSLEGETLVVALVQDSAESKQKNMRDQGEEAYHALIKNLPLPIMIIDRDLKVVAGNQHVGDIHGLPDLHKVIDWKFMDVLSPEDRQRAKSDLEMALATGQSRSVEYQMLNAKGSPVPIKLSISVLLSEQGKPIKIMAIAGNSTDNDHAEQPTVNLLWFRRVIAETAHIIQSIIRFQDPFIADHQERVAKLAAAIAEAMGLSEDMVEGVYVAASFHDIGKFFVPAQLLSRPSKLTPEEFKIVQKHVTPAHDILRLIKFPWPVAKAVLQHHERLDGSGYPFGTKGEEIIQEARILAVADVVEAIASHRPYRAGLGIDVALDEISRKNAAFYDREVAQSCLRLFKELDFRF